MAKMRDIESYQCDPLVIHLMGAALRSKPIWNVPYRWRVNDAAIENLQAIVELTLPHPTSKHFNFILRKEMKRALSQSSDVQKAQLYSWIVRDWGKTILNTDRYELPHYESWCNINTGRFPFRRIASYSKLLAFQDYERWAIYDSRVSIALNFLQLSSERNQIYFPFPPSRSKSRKQIAATLGRMHNGSRVPLDQTYLAYMRLLNALSNETALTLLEIEMKLFSAYEQIAVNLQQEQDQKDC